MLHLIYKFLGGRRGPQPGPRSRLKGRQFREQGSKTAAGSAPTAAAGPVAAGRCRGDTSPPVPLRACAPAARATPGGTRSHPGEAPRHPPGGPLRQGASRGAPSGLGAPGKAAGMRGVASRDRGLGEEGCPRLVAAGRAHSGARSGSLPGGQRSVRGGPAGMCLPRWAPEGTLFCAGIALKKGTRLLITELLSQPVWVSQRRFDNAPPSSPSPAVPRQGTSAELDTGCGVMGEVP